MDNITNIYKELINENQEAIIEKIVNLLNSSYDPKMGIKRDQEEYFTKPSIVNKIDDEVISPTMLLDYLRMKFKNVNIEFLEQVIKDWYNGNFKNNEYHLSKNIPI